MAAGFLSAPGTEYGPCDTVCKHYDCKDTRALAAAPCLHCGEPIGYEVPFYDLSADYFAGKTYAHAKCEERALAEQAAADAEAEAYAEEMYREQDNYYQRLAESYKGAAAAYDRERMESYGGTYRLGDRLPDVPRWTPRWMEEE